MIAATFQRLLIIAGAAGLLVALGFHSAAAWLIFVGACLSCILPPAPRTARRWRLPFLGRRRRRR